MDIDFVYGIIVGMIAMFFITTLLFSNEIHPEIVAELICNSHDQELLKYEGSQDNLKVFCITPNDNPNISIYGGVED